MTKTKTCSKCGEVKSLDDFYDHPQNKDGKRGECITCKNEYDKEYKKEYRRTLDGLATTIYSSQIYSSKKRGHPAPLYTKDELREWLLGQQNFGTIYEHWLETGDKYDKPSVDRIDASKGYSLDNVQLMTWGDNLEKSKRERPTGHQLSEEHKAKIGDIHRGKEVSQETREKISKSGKGRRHSEKTKEQIKNTKRKQSVFYPHRVEIARMVKEGKSIYRIHKILNIGTYYGLCRYIKNNIS